MTVVEDDPDSGSFPAELEVGIGAIELVDGPKILLALDDDSPWELEASCHEGIEGRPTKLGTGEGEGLVKLGPRLKSNAFNDLSSCCSSPSDCVWFSLFFSIIYYRRFVNEDLKWSLTKTRTYLWQHFPDRVDFLPDFSHFISCLRLSIPHFFNYILNL